MAEEGPRVVAIVLAAGAGERISEGEPKAFLDVGGRSILVVAAKAAAASSAIDALVVTVPPGLEERAAAVLVGVEKLLQVIPGGSTRHASVGAALAVLPESCATVVCHDAARALASPDLFTAVARELDGAGIEVDAVIPVVPVVDTLKRVEDSTVVATEPRDALRAAQTPQAFRTDALRRAHRRASQAGLEFTDDAAAIEWAGGRVRVVDGDPLNLKITTVEDLARANALLTRSRRG